MKKALPILLLIAVIGSVCAHFFLFSEAFHFIVDASVNNAGDIALVDNTDSHSRVIGLDKEGKIRYLISTPLLGDGMFISRPAITSLPDGSALVKESHVNYETYVVQEEVIVHYTADGKSRKVATHHSEGETAELMSGLYSFAPGHGYFLYRGADGAQAVYERYELNLQTGIPALREEIRIQSEAMISQLAYTSMGTVYLDSTNVVYLHDAGSGTFTRLYPQEGKSASVIELEVDERGNLLIWDEKASGLYRVDALGRATLIHDTGRRFGGEGAMIRDMLRIDVDSASRFVGVHANAKRLVLYSQGSSVNVLPRRAASYFVWGDLLVFIGAFLLLAAALAFVRWWRQKERLFPLVVKQLAFGIPAIIVGTVVLYSLASATIGDTLKSQYHNTLYDAGRKNSQDISGVWLTSLDLNQPFDDIVYSGLWDSTLQSPLYHVDVADSGGGDVARSFYYYWLLAVRDGAVLTAACEDTQAGIPLRYVYSEGTRVHYDRVLKENKPVYCSTRDAFGSWIITLIPIYEGAEGTSPIAGILEVGTNSSSVNAAIQSRAIFLAGLGCAVMLLVMLLVMLMLTASLRPLNRMKTTMQLVADGQYGLTVKVRSHDEIAQLGRIFNILSQTIVRQIQNLTGLNAAYYRFVPLKLMDLLGGKGAQDAQLGDQALMDLTIMQMTLHDFDALVTSMSTEQLFQLLNEVHETFVPLLNRYGGVIDRYTESGWIALFTGEPYNAVAAGVDIMTRLGEYNELRAARGDKPISLGVAVARGPVMVGIVGQKDRVSAMAISEVVNMTQYLLSIGREIGCGIILADTVKEVGDLGFSTRWLGKLSVAKRSEQIDLYDCYDGDSERMRMRKADTSGDFFAGVAAYTNGEYYRARKAFIDVLRVNPSDIAATAYLMRCDEEFRQKNADEEGGAMFVYS